MNVPIRSATRPPSLCQMIRRNDELGLIDEMSLSAYYAHIVACPICRETHPNLLPGNFSQPV